MGRAALFTTTRWRTQLDRVLLVAHADTGLRAHGASCDPYPQIGLCQLQPTTAGSSDLEVLVDQVCVCLPRRKRYSFWAFCSSKLTFLLKRVLWMIRFSAEAIFASSTSKSGIRIPLTEHEDLRSSTDSTISTSLIHSIASVGNCEQVHTSVLNLIFQQANVAGVGNLSK